MAETSRPPPGWARALRRHGLDAARREEALALVAHTASRELGLAAHPVQLAAASALLCGAFAELATGEGKTLAVALAAASAALCRHAGACRDRQRLPRATRCRRHGAALCGARLRVGTVCEADDVAARRGAYRAGITCVTARELVFDYLRDSVLLPFEPDPLADTVRSFTEAPGPGSGCCKACAWPSSTRPTAC